MPLKLAKATAYWFSAYWIVTGLGILLTVFCAVAFRLPFPQEAGVSMLDIMAMP